MILAAMPNTVIVGSQTAGADGNVTYFKMCTSLTFPNGMGRVSPVIIVSSCVSLILLFYHDHLSYHDEARRFNAIKVYTRRDAAGIELSRMCTFIE